MSQHPLIAELLCWHFIEQKKLHRYCQAMPMNEIKEYRRVCRAWRREMDRIFEMSIKLNGDINNSSAQQLITKAHTMNMDHLTSLFISAEFQQPNLVSKLWRSWLVRSKLMWLAKLFESAQNLESVGIETKVCHASLAWGIQYRYHDPVHEVPVQVFGAMLRHGKNIKSITIRTGVFPQTLVKAANNLIPDSTLTTGDKLGRLLPALTSVRGIQINNSREWGLLSKELPDVAHMQFPSPCPAAHLFATNPPPKHSRLRHLHINSGFNHFDPRKHIFDGVIQLNIPIPNHNDIHACNFVQSFPNLESLTVLTGNIRNSAILSRLTELPKLKRISLPITYPEDIPDLPALSDLVEIELVTRNVGQSFVDKLLSRAELLNAESLVWTFLNGPYWAGNQKEFGTYFISRLEGVLCQRLNRLELAIPVTPRSVRKIEWVKLEGAWLLNGDILMTPTVN